MIAYQTRIGESIAHAIEGAVSLAKANNQEVLLTFNGIDVVVSPKSYQLDIAVILGLKSNPENFSAIHNQ